MNSQSYTLDILPKAHPIVQEINEHIDRENDRGEYLSHTLLKSFLDDLLKGQAFTVCYVDRHDRLLDTEYAEGRLKSFSKISSFYAVGTVLEDNIPVFLARMSYIDKDAVFADLSNLSPSMVCSQAYLDEMLS